MERYGVILAGGGGTRFWPLSRQKRPKQLLPLSGKDLMVNEAADRIAAVIGKSNIFIVTGETQASEMISATEGKVFPMNILAEPEVRNTAACIGYCAMEIYRRYGDGIMLITPADHYIENVSALTEIFRTAISTAEKHDKLVTIGIKPTFPATGFGYIQYDVSQQGEVRNVMKFREKPDRKTAEQFIESGGFLWNSGMFVWKASLILEKLKEYAPDIHECLSRIGDAVNTPEEQKVLHDVYPDIRKISIDYAVMEPAAANGDVLVIPGECGWNDVGSWDMMDVLHEQDENGNILIGDTMVADARDTVIYSSSRTVTAVGTDNIVIVETPDAVMVCRKDKAQDVRKIVEKLKENGREDLL